MVEIDDSSLRRSARRHAGLAQTLHLLTLFALIPLIFTGWAARLVDPNPREPLLAILSVVHGLLGLSIFMLVLARPVLWLIYRPPPVQGRLDRSARVVGIGFTSLFLLLAVALPVTGWLAIDVADRTRPPGGLSVPFDLITWDASSRQLMLGPLAMPFEVADRAALASLLMNWHRALAMIMAVLLLLHVVALARGRWRRG